MGFLAGYNRRQKITIDSDAYISGDLSNQVVVVHLPNTNTAFWANDDGNGTYVRFTTSDGETLLNFEVESYNAGGEDAWWHVEVSTLLSASNTEIYIYYKANSPSDGSNKHGTWDSSFKAVYHLNTDKAEGELDDSTSNNNDLTNSGSIDAVGLVDKGRECDGIDDYLTAGDAATLDFGTGDFTVSVVVNIDPSEATGIICGKWTGTTSDPGWYLYTTDPGIILFKCSDGVDTVQLTGSGDQRGSFHTAGVMVDRSGNAQLYLDGVAHGSAVSMSAIGSVSNALDFVIGSNADKASNFSLDGIVDEIELSNILRSSDYMMARHQSNVGDWLSFGAEETRGIVILRRRMEGY